MKVKKISAVGLGWIVALAMVLSYLFNYLFGLLINAFPSFITAVSGNAIVLRVFAFAVMIIIGFLTGLFLALIYNLFAKREKCRISLE